jgi:crossover junction endodeoxyribonuclease RusA
MIEIEVFLPYPPSINKYYVHTRFGSRIGKSGKKYRQDVLQCVMEQGVGLNINSRICVEIIAHVPDKRKRDLDNILKALLDSLTKADVWVDDSIIDQLTVYRGEVIKDGLVIVKINPSGPLIRPNSKYYSGDS